MIKPKPISDKCFRELLVHSMRGGLIQAEIAAKLYMSLEEFEERANRNPKNQHAYAVAKTKLAAFYHDRLRFRLNQYTQRRVTLVERMYFASLRKAAGLSEPDIDKVNQWLKTNS